MSGSSGRARPRRGLVLLLLLGAYLVGAASVRYELPPYGFARSLYQRLAGGPERGPGARPASARFKRPRGPEQDGLTDRQQKEIEALQAIAYVAGSTPASGASGVTVHETGSTHPGLNLATDGHAPQAVLLDMDGQQVHRWSLDFRDAFPDADVPPGAEGVEYWRRVKLLPGGGLLAIYEGQGLVKLDRDSRLVWAYPRRAHHDLEVLDDGTIYVLTREAKLVERVNPDRPILEDFVEILDADGNPRQRVSVLEAILESPYSSLIDLTSKRGDLLHTNTVEVLDGRIADRVPAFAAGNVLISMPMINTVAVLDPVAGAIVWAMTGMWGYQHDPTILDNGNLMVFDNWGDRGFSRILELDPATQRILWSYDGSEHGFYTQTCGTNQRLPNGNTLITETDNGRALEVTREGTTVWEYYTPHRAGAEQELIASLFEVVRVDPGDVAGWLATDPAAAGAE